MRRKFRKGVFIVVYNLENKIPEYLILKRTLHWKGWEFPKGGVERCCSRRKEAIREIKEETGLDIRKLKNHRKKGKYLYPKKLRDRPGIIGQTYKLYSAEVKKAIPQLDKKEHTTFKWMNFQKAKKTLTHDNQKECLQIVQDWLVKRIK